jgi:hypothetical protein
LRFALRLICPPKADNSTLATREVFSFTHMSLKRMIELCFAAAAAKICDAFKKGII